MKETKRTWVWALGWDDDLEKGIATASVFLFGESHGQRSLVGYKVHKVIIKSWNTIEMTLHAYIHYFYTHWKTKTFIRLPLLWWFGTYLHVWGMSRVEGISRWISFGFLSSVSTCSLDFVWTRAPETKLYNFRCEWNPFPSSPPVKGGEKNSDVSVHPKLLHVWNNYTWGVRKGHLHVGLPGCREKHTEVMELLTEEASHQQAVNHPPSALEATWFGDLGTRVSCLLIVSALNNCLFISQSLVYLRNIFHFLPGPYLLQAIHLSLGALCCHLVNCLLCKVFHVYFFYSVIRKHSFKRNMWETILERV